MSYYGAKETIKASVLAVGLGLHYEDDSTIGDLVNSVASDFDGTVLFSNTGYNEVEHNDYLLNKPNFSKVILTIQVASDVGAERFETDNVVEIRGERVIAAVLGSVSPTRTEFTDLQGIKLINSPTRTNIASGTKVVWECSFLVTYRAAPTPIVYYNSETDTNGDTEITNVSQSNSWVTTEAEILNGGTVSNADPLSGTLGPVLDSVNDVIRINADAGTHLDFKRKSPWTFIFQYRFDQASTRTNFILTRNRYSTSTQRNLFVYSIDNSIWLYWVNDSGNSWAHRYQLDSAGSVNDQVARRFALRYDGSSSMDGFKLFESGVELSVFSPTYHGSSPVLTGEILNGSETSDETAWRLGDRIDSYGAVCSFDDFGFFREALTDAQILAIANGTDPRELTY